MQKLCGQAVSWRLRPRRMDEARALAPRLGVSEVVAELLLQRDIVDPASCERFLQPALTHLIDPGRIHHMDRAVERITAAIKNREKVLVYGDYDVDGVAGTTLMLDFLRLTGLEPVHYIPDRQTEGYSFSERFLDHLDTVELDLIISIDNGITSHDMLRAIRERGLDVIVTDHHEPTDTLPDAVAVVNPKLSPDEYGSRDVCGAAVAYKTIWAVANRMSPGKRVTEEFRQFLVDSLALVSLGTICDAVPLHGENRVFASFGLKALHHTKKQGLRAMMDLFLPPDRVVGEYDVGFRIGPRINAAGRLRHANIAVDLLTIDDEARARAIAQELEKTNQERRQVEQTILEQAIETVESNGWEETPVLVLAGEGWHPGVVGIVASRVSERYHRPAILIALDGDRGRGSARSIHGIHLLELITSCGDHLEKFGGHAFAAGLEIRTEAVDDFRTAINAAAEKTFDETDLVPRVNVDLHVELSQLSLTLVDQLESLAPFGTRNPAPLFVADPVTVVGDPRLVGAQHQHLSLLLKQGKQVFKGIGFDLANHYEEVTAGKPLAVLFTLIRNTFRGRTSVELQLKGIRISERP